MNIPVYQHINVRSSSLDELGALLDSEMNMKHPVVLNLKSMDSDSQRETIGLIENFFVSQNISFKYPYPVYLISDHEPSISKIPLVQDAQGLPKFFTQRESKMNVKESHLVGKNKLLQTEVRNSDSSSNLRDAENYGESHRIIFELEKERTFYRSLLNKLLKVKKNG